MNPYRSKPLEKSINPIKLDVGELHVAVRYVVDLDSKNTSVERFTVVGTYNFIKIGEDICPQIFRPSIINTLKNYRDIGFVTFDDVNGTTAIPLSLVLDISFKEKSHEIIVFPETNASYMAAKRVDKL